MENDEQIERIENLKALLARAYRERRELDRWWAEHLKARRLVEIARDRKASK